MPLFTTRERIAAGVIALLIITGWTIRLADHLKDSPAEAVLIRGAVPVPAEIVASAEEPDAPIDINTASAADLEALPMIGPARAEAIVAWRDAHGLFGTVEGLLDVSGIGPATLERIRDRIRAGGNPVE